MTSPSLTFHHRPVRYHPDASAVFAHLGATTSADTVLLESADITTRSGIASLAVLKASLRLTCQGDTVHVVALSPSGEAIAADLATHLSEYESAPNTYTFPISRAADERERLTAVSPVEPLRLLTRSQGDSDLGLPMLFGGFAFDFLETFEQLPTVAPGPNTYPDYQFILAEIVVDINHQTKTAALRAVSVGDAGVEKQVAEYADLVDAEVPEYSPVQLGQPTIVAQADISDERFREIVAKLQHNIYQGDIYQVVPARTFSAPCPDAFGAYRQLRLSNPSPYMFYQRGVDTQGRSFELFGASPESNLKFEATTRLTQLYPIAGTRPRGLNPDGSVNHELDIRAELELRTDAKEIAEHTMLVDLARNDLARVAVPATRRVADLLQVDRYSRVMHLVSRVTATLDPELDALDAYRACMNMGTLTGAPKLRAMELLREAEGTRRGSYGGAVGYLRANGDMDNCIVIRSAFVRDGIAHVQAGAGVVRDSSPQAEAEETLHKAYAVLNAIALANNAALEVAR